jgi:density-regulated protein DRP1
MPLEYCEYGGELKKCREWLKDNLPDVYEEIQALEGIEKLDTSEDTKSRQKRGGKALKKSKKKEASQVIKISQAQRNKKKFVTIVSGLGSYGIDLKKASKTFAQRFSCGSSVTGEDEVVVQGEVADDMIEYIQQVWPEIGEDSIEMIRGKK